LRTVRAVLVFPRQHHSPSLMPHVAGAVQRGASGNVHDKYITLFSSACHNTALRSTGGDCDAV